MLTTCYSRVNGWKRLFVMDIAPMVTLDGEGPVEGRAGTRWGRRRSRAGGRRKLHVLGEDASGFTVGADHGRLRLQILLKDAHHAA